MDLPDIPEWLWKAFVFGILAVATVAGLALIVRLRGDIAGEDDPEDYHANFDVALAKGEIDIEEYRRIQAALGKGPSSCTARSVDPGRDTAPVTPPPHVEDTSQA